MTRSAVVFGAGKMAGGLLGHLLASSEYTIDFVARRHEVVEAINRRQGYRLTVAGKERTDLAIRGCRALVSTEHEAVIDAVANADVVFTALGVDNLTAVTPLIARGLAQRATDPEARPLNVIACENLAGTGAYLRHEVLWAAAPATSLTILRIAGFSGAVTRRVMTGGSVVNGELCFEADSHHGLIVNRRGTIGALPSIHGMQLTDEFDAHVMRKFFTLNCAQAVAAYVGFRHGCQYIHEAVRHPLVRSLVEAAVAESEAALIAELPDQADAIREDVRDAMARIASDRMPDLISRVARDPRRKLAARERLVGPARLAQQHGLPYLALSRAIAAALAYDCPADPQAVALQQSIADESLDMVLTEECGLLPYSELARAIKRAWCALTRPRTMAPVAYRARTEPRRRLVAAGAF
jgi:mannitol-1-phosphate 5-dehydrogenase